MIFAKRFRKGVVAIFNLKRLSTTRGAVRIIKANDTETTMTLPLVEDLFTDSLVLDERSQNTVLLASTQAVYKAPHSTV